MDESEEEEENEEEGFMIEKSLVLDAWARFRPSVNPQDEVKLEQTPKEDQKL